MKKWTLLVLLCLPLGAFAQSQKGILQLLRKGPLTSRLQQNLEHALARMRFTKSNLLSKLILTPSPTAPLQPVLQNNLALTPAQKKDWLTHYHQTLANFEQFKAQASALLYYQSIPLEAREMSVQEKRYWLDKMLPLYSQVHALYVNTQQDATLKYALDYLRYGISMVDPFLVSTLPATTKPYAAPFNLSAFCLYPQEPLPEPYVDLEGKKIVIINDDNPLLEHFEHLTDIGVLFPGATLHSEGDAMQFLLWLQKLPFEPDIIFTDIQLGTNNGFYIARRLRESGYSGGIIALTSYLETEEYARQLAQAGFDGMVSLDDRYYHKIPFFLRITQAAQVYLRRKKTK
ncbi:MAG: response regulator [Elusimicrobiaceae bacterium]|nr:response regulator [Elusimicrobiaceae bacterium]